MAIIKHKSKVKAEALHFDNLEKVKVKEQSSKKLKNSQEAELLIDPEDEKGGSSHTSIIAAMECPDDMDDEDKGPGPTTIVSEEADTEDDSDDSEEDDSDDVEASEVVLDNAEMGAELVAPNDEVKGPGATTIVAEEPKEEEHEEEEEEVWDADKADHADIFDDSDPIEQVEMEEDEEEMQPEGEMETLLDVDCSDDDGSGTVFASYNNKLMIIKGNRIIATMNKQVAIKSGHLDVYLSDQFEQVVASELAKRGLRAGLKAMGFAMATVNVATASVVNLRVATKVKSATASVHKVVASKQKAFAESLAIAAVGLNRGAWKDITNPLKASLQEELTAAGVRNANRLVHNVFAEHGIGYAKAICAMAERLCEMPQESRNSLTESLDMTNEMVDEDSDLYGIESNKVMSNDESDFEEEDDELGHYESNATVNATLTTAGYKNKTVSHKSTQYSVNASDVLSGKARLPLF